MFKMMLALCMSCCVAQEKPRFFESNCDNFNAVSNCTFKQKYFINDSKWSESAKKRAIVFIPGGEASMDQVYGYQIMHDLAFDHSGILLTMEHRFFGDSKPFGDESFQHRADRIGLLTVEQAMADYITLINHVKKKYNCPLCPVVAGGGSYSGKLAAYMRLKYPSVVSIALAASAPVFLDSPGLADQYRYYQIVTDATRKLSPTCPSAVQAAVSLVLASSTAELTTGLGLCAPLSENYDDGKGELLQRIMNQFADTAMGNYPPKRSPILAECRRLLSKPSGSMQALKLFLDDRYKFQFDKTVLLPSSQDPRESNPRRVAKAATAAATASCYNLSSAAAGGKFGKVVCSDWSGCGSGYDGEAWDYQACTEVLQPLGSNNRTDMFWPRAWTEAWQASHCKKRFGALPLANGRWLAQTMGLDALKAAVESKVKQDSRNFGFSRVIFSNGLQDPWSAGGVLNNISGVDDIVAITMENGAHHVDLRGPDPDDTADVLAARLQERRIIDSWLSKIWQEQS